MPGAPPVERRASALPTGSSPQATNRPTDSGARHRAPLRVEPRRYHQRPSFEADAALDTVENKRWPLLIGLVTLTGLIAVGVALFGGGVRDRFTSASDQAQSTSSDTADNATVDETNDGEAGGEDMATAGAEGDDPTDGDGTGQATTDGEATDGADSLTIRIEPSTPETDSGIAPASATIRTDGKLYVEGAFRSESEARRFLESAAEVFGEAALVPEYSIDPAAPDPTVSDVVLEKPVLFESGSAVIDPEFIPFLEACGDVLKLNSQIVMSVSAFTDASGDAEFNLELSQRRADAVIDFYRNLDIGDDQLISTGLGESDFVADNDTEDGRRQNRRAMLELLNVMKEG